MHAFDWPEQTLKIYMQYQYSTYFACNNDLRSAVLTNLLGNIFLSFLPHLSLEKAWHLRRVKSAKGSQKSEFYILVFDWLEQTDKIRCNIFPVRMTCAALLPDCLGTLSSTLCQMGMFNVPFYSIFVIFHFYLVMTLVVPCT